MYRNCKSNIGRRTYYSAGSITFLRVLCYKEFHCCVLSRATRGSRNKLSLINIQIDAECIIGPKKKLIPRFVRLFQMIAQRNIETIDSISLRSIKSSIIR